MWWCGVKKTGSNGLKILKKCKVEFVISVGQFGLIVFQLFLLQRVKFINCFFFAIFQPFKSLLFNVEFEDIKLI